MHGAVVARLRAAVSRRGHRCGAPLEHLRTVPAVEQDVGELQPTDEQGARRLEVGHQDRARVDLPVGSIVLDVHDLGRVLEHHARAVRRGRVGRPARDGLLGEHGRLDLIVGGQRGGVLERDQAHGQLRHACLVATVGRHRLAEAARLTDVLGRRGPTLPDRVLGAVLGDHDEFVGGQLHQAFRHVHVLPDAGGRERAAGPPRRSRSR